jgi:hypothetical protein
MFAIHQYRVRKSDVRMILLHLVEETGLWSCWTYVCQESLVERTKSCELSDWWQIGTDRRQSVSIHSVNKIQVLSSMIRAVNVSRMQTVYAWRSMCACRLSLVQSLREREIRGRDSVSGPQKLELRKDLCLTRVFDYNVHPPFWLQNLFDYLIPNFTFSFKMGCDHSQTSQKPCRTIKELSIFSNIFV